MAVKVPGGIAIKQVLHDGATAVGNGEEVVVTNIGGNGAMSVLVCHVEGISGDTITFEGTIDGSNWVAIGFTDLADGSTVATTATADGLYRMTVLGLLKVRARISTYGAGTITVTSLLTA